jgi:hypothetical protein
MNGKNSHSIRVFIKPVENREGDFLAFFQSDVLQATFFTYFKDNIMGAIALNTFTCMLEKKYNMDVHLQLLDEKAIFHNKALLDIVSQKIILSQLKGSN